MGAEQSENFISVHGTLQLASGAAPCLAIKEIIPLCRHLPVAQVCNLRPATVHPIMFLSALTP